MRQCNSKTCRKIIYKDDVHCPYCGKHQKRARNPYPMISVVGIVIIGFALLSSLPGAYKKVTNPTSTVIASTPIALRPSDTCTSTITSAITSTAQFTKTFTITPKPSHTPTSIPIAGEIEVSAKDGMERLYVPAGEFLMGPVDNWWSDFSIDSLENKYLEGFWIDKTEITNGMYFKCVEAKTCNEPEDLNLVFRVTATADNGRWGRSYWDEATKIPYQSVYLEKENLPVFGISYDDAIAYCNWAGRRLPTDEEWEKAARGTDGRLYPWGNEYIKGAANNIGGIGKVANVGSHPEDKSPYGSLDMAGNVQEWVENEIIRGGYYLSNYKEVSIPYRPWSDRVGFRCASD